MDFGTPSTKAHIFRDDDSGRFLCGRHEVYIGSLGHFTTFISEKTIRKDKDIICKTCLKSLRARGGK